MSSMVEGQLASAAYVGPFWFSVVNSSFFAHGSQVEPSIVMSGLPLLAVVG